MMNWFVALLTGVALAADPAAEALQQAKSLMTQGQRMQAIAQLDRAATLAKSKKTQRQINEKRMLFAQQFLTSESFQKYQEAKGLAEVKRWDECLREISAVGAGDQNNLMILRLKHRCHAKQGQYEPALKALDAILAMVPGDMTALFDKISLDYEMKNYPQAMMQLERMQPKDSQDVERHAILKARILEKLQRPLEAIEVLKKDQETNLDHVGVLYELGMLYRRVEGNDWPARKMLSLFITRCKRLKEAELKERGYDEMLPQAQAALSEIDRKLGV